MSIGNILYNEFEIEYKLFGSGNEYILAFHGIGREADDYKIFDSTLGKRYTIVAINLFHHGNSKYPEDRLFENQLKKEEFVEHVEKLLSHLNIDKFSVMAYSLGSRFGLSIVELLHNRVNRIILLAPDGLIKSVYTDYLAKTSFGKNWLNSIVDNPTKFFNFIDRLHRYKIFSSKGKKFVELNFGTHEKRVLRRNVLLSFINIIPDREKLIKNINKSKLEILIIYGKRDYVFPPKIGIKFLKEINSKKELLLIEGNHDLFSEKYSDNVLELFRT